MVPIPMFDHMFATVPELPIPPIVVLAGDDRQLQPIGTVEGTIQTTQGVMTSDKLKSICMKLILTEQHRSEDEKYAKFLDHIHLWKPSQKLLNEIQKERILFDHDPDKIFQVLTNFPESTVITVSHPAENRINSVFINKILQESTLLGHVTSDCELGKIPVFKGMRVIITQNENKGPFNCDCGLSLH